MVTHVLVPAYDPNEPASLSPILIDQVLRGQLGYQGVVIIDTMNGGGLLQFMQQQGYSDPAQAIAEASVRVQTGPREPRSTLSRHSYHTSQHSLFLSP